MIIKKEQSLVHLYKTTRISIEINNISLAIYHHVIDNNLEVSSDTDINIVNEDKTEKELNEIELRELLGDTNYEELNLFIEEDIY